MIAAPSHPPSDAKLGLSSSPPHGDGPLRVTPDRAGSTPASGSGPRPLGPSQPAAPNLLQRVGRGDLAAVQTCMNRFGAMVWSMAQRFSQNREDAEDAVQEIFTELWRNAERYDASKSSEEAFVAMIAWRRLVDRKRAARRRPVTETLGPEAETRASPPLEEGFVDSAALERALLQIRPEQREVLLFAACQGLSQQQIASRMGIAVGTVKTHARRGLMNLRALLLGAEGTSQ